MNLLKIIARLIFRSIKKLINPRRYQNTTLLDFYDLTFLASLFLGMFIKKEEVFVDTKLVPEIEYIESNWRIIKDELENLLKQKEIPSVEYVDQAQKDLTSDKHWKMFFIKIGGAYVEQNCALCPETTNIIKKIPTIHSAMFSIIDPHKYIELHNGPFKGDLNYHIGLIVPKGNLCRLEIGGQTKYWEEGKSMLFDDTHIHEAWNDSNEQRAILWAYVERPMPYKWLAKFNKNIIKLFRNTDYVKNILEKASVQ